VILDSKRNIVSGDAAWERGGKIRKSPYLRNGARYDQGYYDGRRIGCALSIGAIVPKSSTLELPWTTDAHHITEKDVSFGAQQKKNWMNISGKKCRPMALVFSKVYADIRWGVLMEAVPNDSGGCRQWKFSAFSVATSSETYYIMAICYPLLACNWLQNKRPRMALNGYFMSNSVFVPALLDTAAGSTFKDRPNCVKSNKQTHTINGKIVGLGIRWHQ